MAALCSRREICSGQARQMLNKFFLKRGVAAGAKSSASENSAQSAVIETVIKWLIGDAFIDDSRFLAAYLKDKIEFAGWGPKKISAQLLEWGFAQNTVDEALAERSEELDASLRKMLEKKKEQLNKESAKKLESAKAKCNAKIEKLHAALAEAAEELERAKERGKTAAVANAYKNLKSANQQLQRAKYEASMVEKALEAANRKKLLSYGVSRGFALRDVLRNFINFE